MSLHEWLRPPRSLLVILFLLTLVSITAVAWFGWKLVQQDDVVEAQRSQERLEQTADRAVATLKRLLMESADRLGDQSGAMGPVFVVNGSTLTALPPARLLYLTYPLPDNGAGKPEAPGYVFADGEALEMQQGQPQAAVDWYRQRAASRDPSLRAGALMRLGRVLRKLGRMQECRAAYVQLSSIIGAQVAGAPADLVGRIALAEVAKDGAAEIKADLLRGRWPLTRAQFEFYWSEAARLCGKPEPAPKMPVELERASVLAWNQRTREPAARGHATVSVDGRAWFLLWRSEDGRRSILVTTPESFLKTVATSETMMAAVDSDGRVVAGQKGGSGRAVVRTAAESQLPWTLYVTKVSAVTDAGMVASRRYLLFGMSVMVLFLIAGTYFIARVIRRENAISRLQSDFVSAVSHEFRSPLTSIRQLSEMLALGRLRGEERRQRYYETLVSETERLQRLVEKLLNFGGMEAGRQQYHFERLDTAPLVEHVAREFEGQIAPSGRLIELHGQAGCPIDADREALSIALRNLVDNALKYSPGQPTVWVEWGRENGSVAIRVRDRGVGIPASERKAIFHKFVRGSAATSGGVKGMGVGLAMVNHIVTAHGGEIRVASEPGVGSTFTMLLPAVRET